MIQAKREAGSRWGLSNARAIVAASVTMMTAVLMAPQFTPTNAAHCLAAVQRGSD
jgi:hypothetical protein